MNSVKKFLQKIENIIEVLDSERKTEDIKTNLLASLYLNLTTKIGTNPKNLKFLDELTVKNPVTIEEFDAQIKLAQEKLKETGFDVDKAVAESCMEVLENFVQELASKLPTEKIYNLRKIIAKT